MGNSLSSQESTSNTSYSKNSSQNFSISVPFQTSSVKIVRLILAGIANHQKFSLDELEDLKIAVGEVFNFYLRHSESFIQPNILVKVATSHDELVVQVCSNGLFIKDQWNASTSSAPMGEVSSLTIIEFLVDKISVAETDEGSVIQFVKISEAQL